MKRRVPKRSTYQNYNEGLHDGKAPQKTAALSILLENGKIVVKEGRACWDRLRPSVQDECREALIWTAESNKGETLFREVEEFFGTPKAPPVSKLRKGIPKAKVLLYHLQDAIAGIVKVNNLWHESNKPANWPSKFGDPNNKRDGSKGKLVQEDLKEMYEVLKREFELRRAEIKVKVEEHMAASGGAEIKMKVEEHRAASARAPQENYPAGHQRLTAEGRRTEDTLAELSQQLLMGSQPQEATKLHEVNSCTYMEVHQAIKSESMDDGKLHIGQRQASEQKPSDIQSMAVWQQVMPIDTVQNEVNASKDNVDWWKQPSSSLEVIRHDTVFLGNQTTSSPSTYGADPSTTMHTTKMAEGVNAYFTEGQAPSGLTTDNFRQASEQKPSDIQSMAVWQQVMPIDTVQNEVNASKDNVDWWKQPSSSLEVIRHVTGFLGNQTTSSTSTYGADPSTTMCMDTINFNNLSDMDILRRTAEEQMLAMEEVPNSSSSVQSTSPDLGIANHTSHNNIPATVEECMWT